MSAFEADRFNRSRTSPRGYTGKTYQLLQFNKRAGMRHLVRRHDAVRSSGLRVAFLAKKSLEHVHAARSQDAAGDLDLMIELGVVEDLEHGMDRTGFWVFGAVDQSADSRVGNGSRAHGARFHRYVEIAVQQAIVSDNMARLAQSLDFSMRCWIVISDRAITSASHDMAVTDDDRTHGNLPERASALRFAQRLLHEQFVRLGHEGEG